MTLNQASREITVNSTREYLEFIFNHFKEKTNNNGEGRRIHCYRGQANIEWNLEPSVFRCSDKDKKQKLKSSIKKLESPILSELM
ncbi:MAG: hypothetical protein LBH31_01795, partial [Burkholderiaceae bacterium]|nr:hypothetical protein [Burkholderiaceae bacterium]